LVDAGTKPSGPCAKHALASKSNAIPILFIFVLTVETPLSGG
jgi:hypothetical protein